MRFMSIYKIDKHPKKTGLNFKTWTTIHTQCETFNTHLLMIWWNFTFNITRYSVLSNGPRHIYAKKKIKIIHPQVKCRRLRLMA